MAEAIQKFVDSYARVGARDMDSGGFLDSFYEHFVSSTEEIANKFVNTNMAKQREMLRFSLDHMVYFAIDGEETPEMKNVAGIHSRSQMNIPGHLYDNWLDSLLLTVREFDPDYDAEIETAWRRALAPAIQFMRDHYDD